jgi:thymidylate synthase
MINEKYLEALLDIYKNGRIVKPRSMEVRELLAYKFELNNPNDNVITIPGFETNLDYAKEELNWYLSGSNRFDWSPRIKRVWERYSSNGSTINSNYGERLFGKHRIINTNQWEQVKEELTRDKDSRRAILNINSYFDKDDSKSLDVPCTIAIQSFIRDDKLTWITYMRSNDINKGFRNDVYCFTELQKKMANELKIDLGEYIHIAGSMHLYSTDYPKVEKLS